MSQPPSSSARIDFLNESGSVTVWVLGSNTGGLRSASANDSAIGALGQPGHLAKHLAGGVDVQIGVVALAERLVDAEYLEQVEDLVTDVALIVAHDSSSMRRPLAVGYLFG